ncbi:MAG: hypothetical protein GY705_21875 [Bacteroidetes bacterium]|nr:hypothetical protein [Bacteroidota bacterium]
MDHNNAVKAGGVCSDLKVDIPMSPLWHMGKAAKFESKASFDSMQKAIDYLTCKAKNHQPFEDKEKEFLKEIYEAFWWGGKYKGWKEAAQLARHYVHGNGKPLSINPDVYKTSVIVKDTIALMKKYIAGLTKDKKHYQHITSGDVGFYSKPFFSNLRLYKRNEDTQGYADNSGLLFAEQGNERLQKSDNRFYLECINSKMGDKKISTRWFVENIYDFKSFGFQAAKKKIYVTDIPLKRPEFVLKLPDGLSYHMTKIGIAKEFEYRSEWSEIWELK